MLPNFPVFPCFGSAFTVFGATEKYMIASVIPKLNESTPCLERTGTVVCRSLNRKQLASTCAFARGDL